jgi:hypothetical protein
MAEECILLRQYFRSHAQLQRLLEKQEVSSHRLLLFLLVVAHFAREQSLLAAIKFSSLKPLIDLPSGQLIYLLHVLWRLLLRLLPFAELLLPLQPGLARRYFVKLASLFHLLLLGPLVRPVFKSPVFRIALIIIVIYIQAVQA